MKLWVSLFSVGVLTAWSPSANALELCAVLDKKTGELKEGSPIKLRSVCKTKKNGTPIEISIGTTEALAAATANTAAREDLEQYLEVDTTNHVVRFTGANVQIRSGAGASWGTGVSATPDVNGLGNLIIGYDENDSNDKTGSHNLVLGPYHTYSQAGGLVAGYKNAATAGYASVTGGSENTASEQYSAVTGGQSNLAGAAHATVSGGRQNQSIGQHASAGGGNINVAQGVYAAVSGGHNNRASGNYAVVSAGRNNTASENETSVSGGSQNRATARLAAVSGGQGNEASGIASHISGGRFNDATATYSVVSGGAGNTASATEATVSGGDANTADVEGSHLP